MASLRTDSTYKEGQSIVRVLRLAAAVTGDTISYKQPVKSWIGVNRTTTDALSVAYDTTTQLFTVTVANTPDIDIWILM